MESKANYALIGTLVLISLFGVMAFVAFLSGRHLDKQYHYFTVVYDTPPRGITVGSEVRFNGIKMGEVLETKLNVNNPNEVLVLIQVGTDTPVMEDTYGQNEPLGLTGLSYIQLFAGNSTKPLTPKSPKDIPQIEGRGSQIDLLLGGSESVIENVNVALARAINLLNDDALEDFHGILANLDTISGVVAQSDISGPRIEEMMTVFEKTATDISTSALAISQTAQDVSTFLSRDDIGQLVAQADKTLVVTGNTMSEFGNFAKSGAALSDETILAVEQFSQTGLSDLSTSLAELKDLMSNLKNVTETLQQNPSSLIVGQKKEVTELPQ